MPRPRVAELCNRGGIKNNLVESRIEGAMTKEEVAGIIDTIREGMGWRPEAR